MFITKNKSKVDTVITKMNRNIDCSCLYYFAYIILFMLILLCLHLYAVSKKRVLFKLCVVVCFIEILVEVKT